MSVAFLPIPTEISSPYTAITRPRVIFYALSLTFVGVARAAPATATSNHRLVEKTLAPVPVIQHQACTVP